MTKVDEQIRIEAARQDPGQFAALYEANFELVYGYVARRVKSRAEIEDLTSETFRRALAALPRYESRGAPFSAWLLRIAANALIDRARRAKRREPAAVDLEVAPERAGAARRRGARAPLPRGGRAPAGPAARDRAALRRGALDRRDRRARSAAARAP